MTRRFGNHHRAGQANDCGLTDRAMSGRKIATSRRNVTRDEAIERLRFAIEEPYAHNIVVISKKTAKALLRFLEEEAE